MHATLFSASRGLEEHQSFFLSGPASMTRNQPRFANQTTSRLERGGGAAVQPDAGTDRRFR
jgi:hypothetical protein